MITVNNGTASAQAIARGATSVATGSAPRTIRASISSFKHHRAQLGGQSGPHPRRRHQPSQDRADLDENTTARKLGNVASAPCAASSRCVWIQATNPTERPAPTTIGKLLHGHLLELADHFTQSMDERPGPSRRSG